MSNNVGQGKPLQLLVVGLNGHLGAASPMAAMYQSADVGREVGVNDRLVLQATVGPNGDIRVGQEAARPEHLMKTTSVTDWLSSKAV